MNINFAFIIIIGYFIILQIVKSKGLNDLIAAYSLIIIIFSAIIGARFYYIIFHDPVLSWNGGTGSSGVWLGGFIGVGLVKIAFHINIWKLLDSMTIPISLGIIIGRIGCYLNKCCYGITYSVQLYESAFGFILLILSIYLLKYSKFDGQSFLALMIIYPFVRILLEFLRGDNTIFMLGFSLPQWIYLTIFITGSILIKLKQRAIIL